MRLNRSGSITLVFALAATVVVTGVGAGIDLMRIYNSQQKASQVAALACQYAGRPSVIATETAGTNGGTTYSGMVTSYIATTWTSQAVGYAQTTATPFTATPGGAANVTVTSSVPTTFMKIAGFATIPIAATSHCYDSPATIPVVTPPSGTYLVQEGFEASPCGAPALCFVAPNGSYSTVAPLTAGTSAFPSSPTFTGQNGSKWYVVGYCAEFDQAGLISASDPEGTHSAELDCDNGVGNKGNSSISTSIALAVGNYELRWFYRARVDYPDYDPTYICGSATSDTSWANDLTTGPGWAFSAVGAQSSRTNQINVYFDTPNASGNPPMHTTLDGAQQLAGSAMIDTCVYSPSWIERSVRIKVTTAGTYWLSFAADGANDSYGGQVDNIRLCQGTCNGAPQDNFPTAWLAANNGGVNKLLFEDTFESPTYFDNTGVKANTQGNLNYSQGTSGSNSSGWPSLPASGWATAPLNEVLYELANAAQGSQSVWVSNAGSIRNMMTGRPFLLVPGFYNLAYSYTSEAIYPSLGSAVFCGATPAAANMAALSGSSAGYARGYSTYALSGALNTNALASFIASGQLASTPIGGGGLNSTTSYTNPDANAADTPPVTTTSTTPTAAPDAISLTAYAASAKSALLDICGYSVPWTARSVNFEIAKSGLYWIYFSTQMAGSSSYGGGTIDDVRLTALGSPAMTSPPSPAAAVPIVSPQTSATQSATGYFIVADPLTYPAPLQ